MAKQAVKARPTGAEKATGAEKSGAKEGFEREPDVTWGYVDSYSVNAERLMIKLNTGGIGRQLVMLPRTRRIFVPASR